MLLSSTHQSSYFIYVPFSLCTFFDRTSENDTSCQICSLRLKKVLVEYERYGTFYACSHFSKINFLSCFFLHRVTDVYWPAKVTQQKIVLFRLSLWDSGESATKKYSHIIPVSVQSKLRVLSLSVYFLKVNQLQFKNIMHALSSSQSGLVLE